MMEGFNKLKEVAESDIARLGSIRGDPVAALEIAQHLALLNALVIACKNKDRQSLLRMPDREEIANAFRQ